MQNTLPIAPVEGGTSIYTSSLDECIKGTYQFSGTLYQNICDGTEYFVANGFWDYSLGFFFLLVGIVLFVIFLRIIFD